MDNSQLPSEQNPNATPAADTAKPAETAGTAPVVPTEQPASQPAAPTILSATPADHTENQASATPQIATHHAAKKPMMLMLGIFVIVLLVAGGVFYVLGVMNKTQRMGAYKEVPAAIKPTQMPMSVEEKEVDAIDTGDPTTELDDLEKEVNAVE